ncbi:TPA: DUF4116 domain-containing protein [Clostridioides difficile]|nr:DUF4116 domain-containing protein [Clostridioides difficile]MDU8820187.1 DUF4116 domain-containing protein [Clostridioides difficile]
MSKLELDLEKVKRNPWELEYAQKQTYEMCIEAIERKGLLLKYVRWDELNLTKKQRYNLYLKAVKSFGMSLKYIKEQTPKICMETVKEDGMALEYVKE